MEVRIRRKLSMAASARDFAVAHPVADTGFATVLKRLDAAVTKADTMAVQQSDGEQAERAARARRRNLRPSIRRNQLQRLVRIAELAARERPELKGRFVMPPADLPTKSFLLAARSLLAGAVAEKDLFISLGIGDTFVEDLTASVDQLDAETNVAHSGRTDHVVAVVQIENLVRECTRDVDLLGTYYRAVQPANSELLGGWASASNVVGPFKHQADEPALRSG